MALLHETTKRKIEQQQPSQLLDATVADPPLSADGFLRVEVDSQRGAIQECPWDRGGTPTPGDAVAVMESDGGNYWVVERWPSATPTTRPAAASVGVGVSYYDTTLSKPVWSDGTSWRDAAGNLV